MKSRRDLKAVTIVWWRFFWRYAIFFCAINLLIGLLINFLGYLISRKLYLLMMLSGVIANIISTMSAMFFCLNHKFQKSSLVLHGRDEDLSFRLKLLTWFRYFWRFAIMAFALGFIFGALLPICFQYFGGDSIKALKYSKYLGNIAVLPASYLSFISLICRKEKRQILRIAEID